MASFYSSVTSEGDMLPTVYMLDQKLASHPLSELPNHKVYVNQPPPPLSYPNLLSGSSVSADDHVEAESVKSRDEMMFIPSTSVPTGMQQIHMQVNITPRYSDGSTVIADPHIFSKESVHGHSSEPNPHYRGLSLSLRSQVPSLVQSPSDLEQHTNSSLCSLISSIKNVEYLSYDLAGTTQDTVKYGAMNNFQNLISSKETSSVRFLHQAPEHTRTFCNSNYLKAAQDILDEIVNVHGALKRSEKGQNLHSLGQNASRGTYVKRDGFSAELQKSTTNASLDLSTSERHDLQNKMTKLLSVLDEVDRRYKHYFHQMQVVVSSFDMVAGHGAAQPYTVLILRTISLKFRCLLEAIKKEIQATQKSLGEQDSNSPGQATLSRLRYMDHQLRQQKALRQFGITRPPWRAPQRGLPETAVSILRAWLFEHFLHPYPKDSEKLVLARQTGLTRSQVANWFINARVRLWKPMIEEMYKELGVAKTEPKYSPEDAAATQVISAFDDREEEFQESLMSAVADGSLHPYSYNALRSDVISSAEIDACSYEAGAYQDGEVNCGLTHLQSKHILSVDGNSTLSRTSIYHQSHQTTKIKQFIWIRSLYSQLSCFFQL
ncbi:hypothetical protein Pfo_017015 [Paulownia fortunei]|nr:hypothetical protein Pfo_017015 [Paulownia fortunei]